MNQEFGQTGSSQGGKGLLSRWAAQGNAAFPTWDMQQQVFPQPMPGQGPATWNRYLDTGPIRAMAAPQPFVSTQFAAPEQATPAYNPMNFAQAQALLPAQPLTPQANVYAPQRADTGFPNPVPYTSMGAAPLAQVVYAPPIQPPSPPPPKRKKQKIPLWARVCVSLLLLLFILSGVGFVYYQTTFAGHINNITNQKAATILVKGKDNDSALQNSATTSNIGTNRINILLLGSDNDEKFFAPLAQTDIVITIDPQTHYVGMLSIPRDLWVNVPGFGFHKLDEAFAYGWQYVHNGPTNMSNAAGLSIATIEQDFGIHIDHYAWVGLDGFIKVIDTAGGVDIDAIHPMLDDIYPDDVNTKDAYGYKRLYVAPGPQHMNGTQALEYVRTRHSDLVGDFGRSQRQQQVLSQLKTKLSTPGIITELPALAKDLDGYVKTDLDIPSVVNLVSYARNVDLNKLNQLVLSTPYTSGFTAPNGEDALKGNCALIMPQVAKMFALGNGAACDIQSDTPGSTPALAVNGPINATATLPASNPLLAFGQAAQVSTLSLSQGTHDLFGIHSTLDLMFLVVFESFDAVST